MFEIIEDTAKLVIICACLHLALRISVSRKRPSWMEPLERRRFVVLSLLVLTLTAAKVTEDVLGGECGLFDETILVFIHRHVPSALTGLFKAITLTGSARLLFPLAAIATVALGLLRRRFESLLVAGSVLGAGVVVYVLKLAVGRSRPALWDADWYWGSSFPSGHTLVVASFATAVALCVGRIRPAMRGPALASAAVWIFAVALSRLALGVHWPTDVLAAVCIGVFLPLAVSLAAEFSHA